MQFSTDRLILRPMRLEDAPFVFELVNTEEWIENIGRRNVLTLDAARKYIQEKMIDHYEKHGYGNFLMIRKADEVKIGCVSLYNRDDVDGVDIGFAMLPQYMSQGYAYEGAKAIKSAARDEYKLSGITAFTTKENVISQKLITKLGLEFKKTIIFGDEEEELLFYELKF